jgi:phage baseplate assembly protein W
MALTTTHTTYGSPVSTQVKRAVKSKYRRKVGFAYPLIGKFTTTTGGALQENYNQGSYFSPAYGTTLIRNNLRQLLLCEKGERIMRPNYGVSIRKFIFEPLDEVTFFLVRGEVLSALSQYFSYLKVVRLGVFGTEDDMNKTSITIVLTLQILDESLDIFDVEVNIG